MFYRTYVALRKTEMGQRVHRARHRRRSGWSRTTVAEDWVRRYAPGKSFVDIGGMWNIHGAYALLAEECGATDVALVDVTRPKEFDEKLAQRSSKLRFVHGSTDDESVLKQVGPMDVVWCWGVLYHHPNPYQMLASLRTICTETLLLETLTIPENNAIPNSAVYYPYCGEKGRKIWLTHKDVHNQFGISEEIRPHLEYSNHFWGLSPSCIRSLLNTAGFTVEEDGPTPRREISQPRRTFRHLFVAKATHEPVIRPFGPPATVSG